MDKFSTDEINLIFIYDLSSRETLRNGLVNDLCNIYDPELAEIYKNTIRKLETLTDEEFSCIGSYIYDRFVSGEDFDIAE